jgi:hypothetical protein
MKANKHSSEDSAKKAVIQATYSSSTVFALEEEVGRCVAYKFSDAEGISRRFYYCSCAVHM